VGYAAAAIPLTLLRLLALASAGAAVLVLASAFAPHVDAAVLVSLEFLLALGLHSMRSLDRGQTTRDDKTVQETATGRGIAPRTAQSIEGNGVHVAALSVRDR
jgi:hypothetical protein